MSYNRALFVFIILLQDFAYASKKWYDLVPESSKQRIALIAFYEKFLSCNFSPTLINSPNLLDKKLLHSHDQETKKVQEKSAVPRKQYKRGKKNISEKR